jgi:bacterioferritin-associated ferredoxin
MTEPLQAEAAVEDIVCYCAGVSRQHIENLVAGGESDFEHISRITGACSGCGGCEYEVQGLISGEGAA